MVEQHKCQGCGGPQVFERDSLLDAQDAIDDAVRERERSRARGTTVLRTLIGFCAGALTQTVAFNPEILDRLFAMIPPVSPDLLAKIQQILTDAVQKGAVGEPAGQAACSHPPGSAECPICTLAEDDETSAQAIAAAALGTRKRKRSVWAPPTPGAGTGPHRG